MVKLKFIATPDRPRHLHKKGGVTEGTYAGKPTTKLVEPEYLNDGDECEMTDFEAQWCLAHLPKNFVEVKAKAKKESAPESESEES